MQPDVKNSRSNAKLQSVAVTPLPAIERVPGDTANSRAYGLLKEAVLGGSFRPGQIITLRLVNELIGLGEMPAREALKRLISEGAFKAMPNRSARVPVLDGREIKQLLELRFLLESNAAALAAENMTLHQIEHLRDIHERMVACVPRADLPEYKRLNMAFHHEIYRIADNEPLAQLIETLWLRMAPFISRTISWVNTVPGRFEQVATGRHEELLVAFQKRDAAAARLAMQLDLADIHENHEDWDAPSDL